MQNLLEKWIGKPVTIVQTDYSVSEDGIKYRSPKATLHRLQNDSRTLYVCSPSTGTITFMLKDVEQIKGGVITLKKSPF